MLFRTVRWAEYLLIVLIATPLLAFQLGQPGSSRTGTPPGSTPPTFPSDSHPSSTMPPDTKAPPATESSNDKIAGQIKAALAQEDDLRNVDVEVTDDHITLSGDVSNERSRRTAIRIAVDHAGSREITDKLRLRQ